MGAPGSFVGRAAELTALIDALDAAIAGRAGAVLVAGEAGIGKTRLLEEFKRLAGSRSVPVLWGRATSEEGAPAFWPWRQVLRSWLAGTDAETARALLGEAAPDLARIARELAAFGEDDAPAPVAVDAEQRFALFETTSQFLTGVAADEGLVVVLDDLHWADSASLRLFAHVVRNVRDARLLLAGAFRPVDLAQSGQSGEIVADIGGQPSTVRLDLSGLAGVEVAQQLAHVLGESPSSEVAATVTRRTAGNPLFVQEVGRLLATGADGVPTAVQAAIRQRLSSLSPGCRALLAAAAIIGVEIDPALLAAVAGRDIETVMDNLDEALAAGLVTRPRATVGYRFTHDLIGDCCLLDLTEAERCGVHLAVAERLGSAGGEGHISEVAYHRIAALPLGDPSVAADAAATAAQLAMAQLAYEDAARLYGRALDAPSAAGAATEHRARLLVEKARAHHLANDGATAMAVCEEAAALAQHTGDAEALGRAALVLEDTSEPDWLPRIGGWCQTALAGLVEGDSPLRARLLAQQAITWLDDGVPGRMETASADALAMAERLDDPTALATALRARQLTRSSPDGTLERLGLADRMQTLGERTGDASAVMWGHLWRIDALVGLGRIDEAESELVRLEAVVSRMSQPLARWHLLRVKGAVHVARGRFAEGLAATEQAAEAAAQGRHTGAVFGAFMTTLVIAVSTGDDLADPGEVPEADQPGGWAPVAEWHLAFGRRDEAGRLYSLLPPLPSAQTPFSQLPVDAMRGALAAALGDRSAADAAYHRLLPHADLHVAVGAGVSTTRGSTQYYLGVTAAGCGRLDTAVEHLRAAVAANAAAGLPPCTAESQCKLAETLLARDEPGDREQASVAATDAKAIANRIGMRLVANRTDAVLATLGPGDGGDPLSRREREIAGLVAEGLTNRQIAARLHIAERTAENHVQHILVKLGFNTRSQIAAWATARSSSRSTGLLR